MPVRCLIYYKPWICLLLFFCAGLWGCEQQSTQPPPAAQQQAQPPATVERVAEEQSVRITLDDAEGTISTARNFYFIFDGSGSMAEGLKTTTGSTQSFKTKIDGAKWAVHEFMKKVPLDVYLGLYVFDSQGDREVLPLGLNNNGAFLAAIDTVDVGGGTPLARAIEIGTDHLIERYKKQLAFGEFRLIVVTDGEAQGLVDAARYATERTIPIYTIGLGIGDKHPLREHSISYRAADSFEDLRKGLEDTIAELPQFDPVEFTFK